MKRNRKRPFKADAWVHVYKRRKDKFLLFYTTRDFLVYYTLFFCLAEKHKVRTYGLCIMVDHVHELLQASERERLENFERELNSRFAKEWNFAHNTVGQVFSRFGNSIKLGDKQKRTCVAYLANNPVERHICVNAEQYTWTFLLPDRDTYSLSALSEDLLFKLKRVEALRQSGRPLTYLVLDNLVAGLDAQEQKILVGHIIKTYDALDRQSVLNLYGDEATMIIAVNSNTGSEYDIKESFSGVSDAVYSKIRLILDRDYNVKSPADVIHWDIDKKIAALHDLMSKSSATMAQVAKYLHLSIIEDKGVD